MIMMPVNNKYLMIYTFSTSILGTLAFISSITLSHFSNSIWLMIAALTISVILLNHFEIQLPPKGNTLSMDSAIFLASLFLFGPSITLLVLLFNSIVIAFSQKNSAWWKHILNFSNYTLMILGAYYCFTFTGGEVGSTSLTNLIPYMIALTSYLVTNILLVAGFFLLSESTGTGPILKEMFMDTIATYLCTLLLSMVLVILIHAQNLFGLLLFITVFLLLAQTFRQNFKLYKAVSFKANMDDLTGLCNHGYFKELLTKELTVAAETETALCIAILDIDDFKKYNDLHGHIQGDLLLNQFGTLLKTECERKNYCVARYGGEEFSIIMPNTLLTDALSFINYLRKLTNDTPLDGVDVLPYGCLSFSAGIAEWEKDTLNSSELLNKADQALYKAKNQGKNLVQCYNQHSDYTVQQSSLCEKELAEVEQQLKLFLSKDIYTYRHSKRVYQYAVDFSKKLELNEHERKTLIMGALVHDIGKIEIPRDILNKKGKLDDPEWEIMKKHVTWGKEIMASNKKLTDILPLIELHHERYDGTGYPYGLKGKKIPHLARILCIIDSFDAMTSERPYQKTKSWNDAIIELRKCAGKQFDPEYIELFIEMLEMNDSIRVSSTILEQPTG